MKLLEAKARWRRLQNADSTLENEIEFRKVFVGGCPRSGTTWAWSILNEHPSVIAQVESKAYPFIAAHFDHDDEMSHHHWRQVLASYDASVQREGRVGIHHYIDRQSFFTFR